jgi:hypothetical protein
MPNIYYCHPINRGSGILRAVLSSKEATGLLSEHPVLYAGQQFPTMRENQNFDFVVLRIFDEELGKKWQAGFYLFDEDIAKIEQAVQACTAKLSRARSKLQTPVSLAYSMLHSGGEPREQGSNP